MEIVLVILAGLLFISTGVAIGVVITYQRSLGDLRVDHSDSYDAPGLFLELDTDVNTIIRKKYVIFRVKAEDFIPHK